MIVIVEAPGCEESQFHKSPLADPPFLEVRQPVDNLFGENQSERFAALCTGYAQVVIQSTYVAGCRNHRAA